MSNIVTSKPSFFKSKTALVIAATTLATSAIAAPAVDSAAIVTMLSETVVVIAAIGMAVLSLVVTIKLFKWVQRTL